MALNEGWEALYPVFEVDGISYRYSSGDLHRTGMFHLRTDAGDHAAWTMWQKRPYCEPCWLHSPDENYFCECPPRDEERMEEWT